MGSSNDIKADAWFLLVTILAAVGWIFSKEAVLIMPPLLFICLRFLIAGVVLSMVGRQQIRGLSWGQCQQAIKVGCVFAVGTCFWVLGLSSGVSISVGGFLVCLAVVMVPILDRIFFKQSVPIKTWFALPVAAIGLGFLTLKNGLSIETGQVLFLMASLFFAMFFILNVRAANHREVGGLDEIMEVSEKVPALSLTAITLLTVGVIAAGASFILESERPSTISFSINLVFWVLASALLTTAARFFIQTHAQSLSKSSHGVVIMVVEPIWTALLAAAWFGESLSGFDLLGCGLIFSSIIIYRWTFIHGLFRRSLLTSDESVRR